LPGPLSFTEALERSTLLAEEGRYAESLRLLRRIAEKKPDWALVRYLIGNVEQKAQSGVEGQKAFVVHSDAARAVFPGPDYLVWLCEIHRLVKPARYLEIGVASGKSLCLVPPGTLVTAVDPDFQITHTIRCLASLYRMTSDAFFETEAAAAFAAGRSVDLAFLDGLHLLEQTLKDFVNTERYCRKDSAILLHDVWPVTAETASRERSTRFWVGDVWKMIPVLKRYRPSLSIRLFPAFPSGLALVTGLDPDSGVLAENFHAIVAEFVGKAFDPENFRAEIEPLIADRKQLAAAFVGDNSQPAASAASSLPTSRQ